ncbi:MAG: M28 family peptidase, partial [Parvularculaceae bacterium]
GSIKRANAAARGARGFITIRTSISETRSPWSRVIADPNALAMAWIGPDGKAHAEEVGVDAGATMSEAGATKLFAGSSISYDSLRAREAAGEKTTGFVLARTASLRGATTFETAKSPNVIAYIEGADPTLKNEAVVLTAHLDHIGVRRGPSPDGDVICNGAIDNAIGVAVILEAARRFSIGARPRRSIYFIALTGEEKGLLGADYFTRFPTIGDKRIIANVNLDMPMALYDFVDVIAFGAERSTLGDIVKAAANSMGVALSPDPFPEQGVFTRSDHYRFVERGVPSVFLILGFANGGEAVYRDFLKNRYHQPTDDLSQAINYDAAARFSELNYRIARDIADADEAPLWRDGDYFADLFAPDAPRAPSRAAGAGSSVEDAAQQ